MELQCGGLAGLGAALGATETDVHRLAAPEHWCSPLDLPPRELVQAVADCQIRRRQRDR